MNQYAGSARADRGNAVVCDLRSDTVTQPCAAMRKTMADAEVGDDVYGEDPVVNRLQATLAERLGKEAGLFVPSGTMSNFLGMLAHCQRGEEILIGEGYHVNAYEAQGASVLGGIALCTLPVAEDGALEADVVAGAVKDDDSHLAITKLLSLENTHNGMAVSLERTAAAVNAGREHGLSTHLDGARFFNAITSLNCAETDLSGMFDTVSICLSKGLGAPVGSVLIGPKDLINRARRWRKMVGGGMRQAGVLAAAGLYALDNNVAGLAEDRARAAQLAQELAALGAGTVTQSTNMVFFTPDGMQNDDLRAHLTGQGVVIGGGAQGAIRLVLHKDVDDEALRKTVDGFQSFFA
ncbi:MAG: low-specificity L-threonine aldolase [Pelagimonas sp.]